MSTHKHSINNSIGRYGHLDTYNSETYTGVFFYEQNGSLYTKSFWKQVSCLSRSSANKQHEKGPLNLWMINKQHENIITLWTGNQEIPVTAKLIDWPQRSGWILYLNLDTKWGCIGLRRSSEHHHSWYGIWPINMAGSGQQNWLQQHIKVFWQGQSRPAITET